MPTRQATTLPCQQLPVGDGNWDTNRGFVQEIVLHTMDGFVAGTATKFNTPGVQVSAHYGVGVDGKLYQWVDEDNVAYANGNYLVNQIAISIEHEDLGQPNNPRPDILYQKSAQLIADICKFYDFPADEEHILIHRNVIDKSFYAGGTACPDTLDTDRLIAMAAAILNPPPVTPEPAGEPATPSPVVNPTPSAVTPVVTLPSESPSITITTPSAPLIPPIPAQTDTNTVPNTPAQTPTATSEASLPPSGQAGRVPFSVLEQASAPSKSNRKILIQITELLVKLLSVIGIERRKA